MVIFQLSRLAKRTGFCQTYYSLLFEDLASVYCIYYIVERRIDNGKI